MEYKVSVCVVLNGFINAVVSANESKAEFTCLERTSGELLVTAEDDLRCGSLILVGERDAVSAGNLGYKLAVAVIGYFNGDIVNLFVVSNACEAALDLLDGVLVSTCLVIGNCIKCEASVGFCLDGLAYTGALKDELEFACNDGSAE